MALNVLDYTGYSWIFNFVVVVENCDRKAPAVCNKSKLRVLSLAPNTREGEMLSLSNRGSDVGLEYCAGQGGSVLGKRRKKISRPLIRTGRDVVTSAWPEWEQDIQ
jgi:hypothetical protein